MAINAEGYEQMDTTFVRLLISQMNKLQQNARILSWSI